jgi:hypothetical protein
MIVKKGYKACGISPLFFCSNTNLPAQLCSPNKLSETANRKKLNSGSFADRVIKRTDIPMTVIPV